jgi:nitroreductase
MLVQIADEGLGGVWLGWYPDKDRMAAFSSHFGLPVHILPFSIIALGYPAKTLVSSNRFDSSRVHYDSWGKHQDIS